MMNASGYYELLGRLFADNVPTGGASKVKAGTTSKKTAAKKTAAKKATPKKTVAKKATPKKVVARKTPAKKVTSRKKTTAVKAKTTTKKKTAPRRARTARTKTSSLQKLVVERELSRRIANLKQRVEASKFYSPIQPVVTEPEIQKLPEEYGRCRIICMVRDPYWLHAYWEITADKLSEAKEFFGDEWDDTKTVLRVRDVTDPNHMDNSSNGFFDIELSGGATFWYINVNSPNSSYVIEITRISQSGRIFVLARSNVVTTPRDGMSDILDEEWMSMDFDRMYALSGGFKIGANSVEMHEMMKERISSNVSSWGGSQGISSFGGSPVAQKQRGFWFILDCELIVYGATEPDAQVTMQGLPIKLRPDGTFTVRFALPDGVQEINTTAISADGVEERTITPTVSRQTVSAEKMLKDF